jgi:hypothetical protein
MKTFTTTFSGSASEMVNKAKATASNAGADFNGDEESGTFSGKGVNGRYSVNGNSVEITITDKPFFAPWGMVEDKIKSFFK